MSAIAARYCRRKRGTQESYVIDAWQRHPLAARSLAEIKASDMAAYRDAREYEVSAKTIRLHLATISHLFTVATQEWGMGGLGNPVLAIRKPRLPQGRDRRLEAGEEARLIEAWRRDYNESRPHTSLGWLTPVEYAAATVARSAD